MTDKPKILLVDDEHDITTNLAANVVAPANGFSNLAPGKISFKMGGYITAGIGIA